MALAKLKTDTDAAFEQAKTDTNNQMEDLKTEIKTDIESLRKNLDSLKDELEATKQNTDPTQQDPQRKTPGPQQSVNHGQSDFMKFRENMNELELIKSKKNNIIIHNLPESGSPENDLTAAAEMIAHEFKLRIKINSATRLGKPDSDPSSKPRLLRIEIAELSERKQILARANELRSSTHDVYKLVYIRPDLTKRQMEESKNLQAKLVERRTEQPNKKWVIWKGRIIQIKEGEANNQ